MTDDGGAGGARTLRRPTPTEAAEAVRDGLDRGGAASVVGSCDVVTDGGGDEHGRDRSSPPVRHVLVKPGGAVVVHDRAGTAAAAEFAAADGLAISADDGRLRLRVGSAASLDFDRVELVACFDLDAAETGREGGGSGAHDSIRDRLLADPDLVEPGFRPLSTERETGAGPVDLYGRDAEDRAVVVEVKAHRAGPTAVGQLDRYVAALARDLHAGAEVRGVLVAPSATDRTRALLAERGYSFVTVGTGA